MERQQQSVLHVGPNSDALDALLTQRNYQLEVTDNLRACKKLIRKKKPGLIIFNVEDKDSEALTEQVLEYVRIGCQDKDLIFIVAHPPARMPDALSWIENYDISSFISLSPDKTEFNLSVIERNLKAWQRLVQINAQHKAESDLLMSVAHLHRNNNDINEVMLTFMRSLANIACATTHCRIKINNQNEGALSHVWPEQPTLEQGLSGVFALPALPAYLARSLTEKKPQIDLLPNDDAFQPLNQLLGTKLSSYLIFPIVVYDKVLEMMIFFIDEQAMESVSMRQIDVVSKAAEQLTILLERKESERRLKKQCTRLKEALLELKETQNQLAHSEKMATVGQFAAGIAHEINNPLSSVLSNFGSMDNYLDSILNLQNLHDQFLNAVEGGNQHTGAKIKSQITNYRGQSDIDFIYDDIREIVAQSQMGLSRVSDIIKDLQSFTVVQNQHHCQLDIPAILTQSLSLLEGHNKHDIVVETHLAHTCQPVSNSGFVQQILTNLLKNAFQAVEQSQPESPYVAVCTKDADNRLVITVKDNGPGIPLDIQDKVFDPFFTTKAVGQGSGLGLSVSYNLSKRLGGELSLVSTPNAHTEFTLSLPIN
ncbi:ATP-binding protein [Pseudoalteromonas luteoviolacea]|uniref:sensor histidine kinase n=1 Tax=Pseudoalteromonas luteoviolacea TaxID=43657 RepID=UPI001F3ECF08|nr:ATP-binding protein [Pseudoalteromonas luteoviolacea]MCF6441348.1 ATP-binding protein [Pseudoalteromonas luteoviolacea]